MAEYIRGQRAKIDFIYDDYICDIQIDELIPPSEKNNDNEENGDIE